MFQILGRCGHVLGSANANFYKFSIYPIHKSFLFEILDLKNFYDRKINKIPFLCVEKGTGNAWQFIYFHVQKRKVL